MKKLITYIVLLLTYYGFAQQKPVETDLEKYQIRYKEIHQSIRKQPLDSSEKHLEKLVLDLKNKIENNHFNKKEKLTLNNLYSKSVVLLCGTIYINKREFEPIKKYDAFLTTLNPVDYYWLGRLRSILGWVYKVELNQASSLISLRESIDYFNKTDHKGAQFRKIQILNELISSFVSYNLIPKAKELLPVLEFELNQIDQKKLKYETLLDFEILKIKILTVEDKKEEALEKLKTINLNKLENKSFLIEYYFQIRNIYRSLNEYNLFLKYHKKLVSHPAYSNFHDSLRQEITGYLFYYLEKNDKTKATEYFKLYQKNPYPNEAKIPDVQYMLARYYDTKENYKLALKHQKKLFVLEDSIFKMQLTILNKLNAYELLHENDLIILKSENKLKEEALESEKKQNIYTVFIICLSFICLFLIFFYFRNKKQLKTVLELEKTKEILNYKNNFLENISHEMRTPLTVIIGYLSLIKNKVFNPKKTTEYADLSIKSSENLLVSLNKFLQLLRLEKNDFDVKNNTTQKPVAFFEEILNAFKGNLITKKINLYFNTNLQEKASFVFCYSCLKIIIENLMTNAIKYSNSHSDIFINCTLNEHKIILSVKDHGIGIDVEEQKHIFSRFYQSKKHSVTGGFGIGLALISDLIAQLNGEIEVKSEPNVGSIFTIEIPHQLENYQLFVSNDALKINYLFENESDSNNDVIDKNSADQIEPLNRLPKALVIDDNIEMISYYKAILSDFLDCTYTFNGQEALDKINENKYDIIISDFRMPYLDGKNLKEVLNKNDTHKEIPFLMVTATPNSLSSDLKTSLGIQDYIVKPFDTEEFLTKVQFLLGNNLLKKNILDIDSTNIELKNTYAALISKINTLVLDNIKNPKLNVIFIASEIGYEQKQLNRILQKQIGMTAVQVIIEIKLKKAYNYIVNNTLNTLSEVMYESGFNSRPHFYNKFEERFGIKPGELKEKHSY